MKYTEIGHCILNPELNSYIAYNEVMGWYLTNLPRKAVFFEDQKSVQKQIKLFNNSKCYSNDLKNCKYIQIILSWEI